MIGQHVKDFLSDCNGGQPPNPRSLSHYGPKYERTKNERPHMKSTASHTSVTFSALGLLSSIALSSGRMTIKIIKKTNLQEIFNEINGLKELKIGNYNCR
jgi:hypothetical protein